MEDLQEVQMDENRALAEKKPKRIVKTPAQVAALENFYNEHKYPTEVMKAELADSIGLTEKQVSGWFCHRRLKDRKPQTDEAGPHGKQDRSSGVIQDRGSGLRQDSCGSTKQGENKHYDLKEVESRRLSTEGLLPVDVRYDRKSQHNSIMDMDEDHEDDDDDDDDDDDTSSGSSSPLKDNFYSQNVDRLGPLASRYPTHNDLKGVNGRTGPSGYLKVKGQVENAAITAVKRQLGRNYIEDGPALGIEFEPLPPGAFENPVNTPVNHSYFVGDSTALRQLDGSRTFQLPYGNKMHEPYNPKSYDPVEFDEPTGLETRYSSKHSEKSQHKSTHPISKYADNQFESKLKHSPGVIRRPDSSFNHHLIGHEKNFHGKQAENYMRSGPTKVSYRDRVDPLTSDFAYKRGEVLQREDKGLSRKAPKVLKRSRDEFMHQVYPRNEVSVDIPPLTNKIARPMAPMAASFSDDESAETASSGD